MSIQVKQVFPHCERCGRMVHTRRARIVAGTDDGQVIFCSELCRDEYAQLFGLVDRGHWIDEATQAAGVRGVGQAR